MCQVYLGQRKKEEGVQMKRAYAENGKQSENRLEGYSNVISMLAKTKTTQLGSGHAVFHLTH